MIAGVLCRNARNAELSSLAASQAEALFRDDSLVVANLRLQECQALNSLAIHASGGAEREVFTRKLWNVLLLVINLLLRRLEASTLLPGTIRAEEMEYEVHTQTVMKKAKNEPVPPPAVLRDWASTMGYNTLMFVMFRSLDFLPVLWWPPAERRFVESFVLKASTSSREQLAYHSRCLVKWISWRILRR